MIVFQRSLMVIALVCCLAGEGMAQKKGFWKSIVAYLDSSNVKGVDPAYITQPDKPWALVLNSNTGQTDLEVSTTMVTQTYKDEITINLDVKPPVSSSIGLWAGYRGWGAGYSLSLSGNSGYNFDLNMVSTSYGINLSIKRFSFDKPRNSFSYSEADGSVVNSGAFDDEMMDKLLNSPMKIGTVMFDAYWIFNKKRFSLLAAYDQSTIQRRSAGSLIAGLMYYYQKLDYDSPKNFFFIEHSGNVGLMKVYQGSIGLGYTYNWVPARGLVVNAVAMPVLTLVNKVKSSRYEIEYPDEKDFDTQEAFFDAITMKHTGDETLNGGVRLNLDLRASASYSVKDWYFGVTGQGRRYHSNNDNTTIKLTDWNVKAFIGRRL